MNCLVNTNIGKKLKVSYFVEQKQIMYVLIMPETQCVMEYNNF